MDSTNPYSAPQAELLGEPAPLVGGGVVPQTIVEDLVAARRWMAACAVAAFVATSAVLVGATMSSGFGGAELAAAVFAALTMAATLQLVHAARAIGHLSRDTSAAALARVTGGLAGFWRLAGGLTLATVTLTMFGSIAIRLFLRAA